MCHVCHVCHTDMTGYAIYIYRVYYIHVCIYTTQGESHHHSQYTVSKSLRSTLSAEFWSYCALCELLRGTQRGALLRHQGEEEMYLLNI